MATLGIAAGAVSVSKAHRSRAGAARRDEAITIGILGIILSGLAAVVYVTLWIYLPSQIVYSPLWS